MNINAIRSALRKAYGTRKYRITRNGEIHVFGIMPNTNKTGWYLFGYVDDSETHAHIETL